MRRPPRFPSVVRGNIRSPLPQPDPSQQQVKTGPPRPQRTFTARSTSVALLPLASCSTIPPEEPSTELGSPHSANTWHRVTSPSLHQGQEMENEELEYYAALEEFAAHTQNIRFVESRDNWRELMDFLREHDLET